MQGHGSATTPHLDDDSEHTSFTPRGMAAPPPAGARRSDVDTHRPATIRIEAKTVATLATRRDAEPPRAPETNRLPRVPMAGDRLQGLVVSQGLLLNAFVLLLVFGWSSPLPGRRYLLSAFAVGGIVLAVLIHLALRQARRAPNESDRAVRTPEAWFGLAAVRALPAALVGVWIALGIYALALPPTANAFQESRPAAVPAPRANPAPARSRPVDAAPGRESTTPPAKRSWFNG